MSESAEVRACDYDTHPERFRLARAVLRRHGTSEDVHARVARRLLAEGATPVVDVGCGEGELARHLPARAWVGVDASESMLSAAPEPHLRADATSLPFAADSFGAVALLYVLYHLADPRAALAEAHRVLRPGGIIAVAAPSRHDSPELAHVVDSRPLTFDAELAPPLLAERFVDVDVVAWDAPLLTLPSPEAVRDYLIGRQVAPVWAAIAAGKVGTPLRVTKRGAIVFARKARSRGVGSGSDIAWNKPPADPLDPFDGRYARRGRRGLA
jgi:SAM-dependent methyltransferase